MVQRNGIPGLVRFKMLRLGISKYCTWRFASSSSLCDASFAMPTKPITLFSLFVRLLASGRLPNLGHYFDAEARRARSVRREDILRILCSDLRGLRASP